MSSITKNVTESYDASLDADKVYELNPEYEKYTDTEVLINTTNAASGTAYYPDSDGTIMDGYKDIDFQINVAGGVTVTFERTDEGTSGTRWLDCTKSGVVVAGSKAGASTPATFVDEDQVISFKELNAARIRAKVVKSDATNTIYISQKRKGF